MNNSVPPVFCLYRGGRADNGGHDYSATTRRSADVFVHLSHLVSHTIKLVSGTIANDVLERLGKLLRLALNRLILIQQGKMVLHGLSGYQNIMVRQSNIFATNHAELSSFHALSD